MTHRDNPHKSTMEIYQNVVQVEVRSLVKRVGELTGTVGALFEEVSAVAFSLEATMDRVGQLEASVRSCKKDIEKLKDILGNYDETLGKLMANICQLETIIDRVNKQEP